MKLWVRSSIMDEDDLMTYEAFERSYDRAYVNGMSPSKGLLSEDTYRDLRHKFDSPDSDAPRIVFTGLRFRNAQIVVSREEELDYGEVLWVIL